MYKCCMKFFTILFIFLSINLSSQDNYPNYSTEMFNKDTANIAMYAIDLPLEKKAELYAQAELWAIEGKFWATTNDEYLYFSRPDTIYKHNFDSKKKQKKRLKELKNEFLLAKKYILNYRFYAGWQVYYFFDINKDGKLDIIKVHNSCEEDSVEIGYPHVSCNFYTFYLSTPNKFYNKYESTGRINTIKELQNEFHFTKIAYDCCDQIGTYISKFHIPTSRSEIVYDYIFWGHFLPPDKYGNEYNGNYHLPKNLTVPKYNILCRDFQVNVGTLGPEWKATLMFKKNSIVRIFSIESDYYFIELKVKKEMNKYIRSDNIYVIMPCRKGEFETIAESIE